MEIIFDGLHLSLRERILVVAGVTATIALMLGLLGGWIGAYWGARRAGRRAVQQALTNPSPEAQRLAQLTQAIDAMALEVERISEAQRFLVKLQSEREAPQLPLTPAASARMPGSVTPH